MREHGGPCPHATKGVMGHVMVDSTIDLKANMRPPSRWIRMTTTRLCHTTTTPYLRSPMASAASATPSPSPAPHCRRSWRGAMRRRKTAHAASLPPPERIVCQHESVTKSPPACRWRQTRPPIPPGKGGDYDHHLYHGPKRRILFRGLCTLAASGT